MPEASVPGVTIIRPLCGLDNNMFNTLESMMRLDYPNYEVIFALQDDNDEALPVVRMVMDKNPDVDARVIISECLFLPSRPRLSGDKLRARE